MKEIINKVLKSFENIIEIEEYNLIFKEFIMISEYYFPFLSYYYSKIIIFISYIKFDKIFHFFNSIKDFIKERKKIIILDNNFI